MLPLAGCDDTEWVDARDGAIPGSEEKMALLCSFVGEFSDFGGCNIGWGGTEHTKVPNARLYPTLDKAVLPSPKGDLLSDAIEGGHESDGTPLYLCSVDYKGAHPGKTREGFNGCNIGWGGKEISEKPFSILVSSE